MRSVHPFNHQWLFYPERLGNEVSDAQFEGVTLPHTNKLLPYHNFDNAEYQFVSTYRKRFVLPEARQGRRVFLDFEGAMMACEVWLNGHKLGEHEGGFLPFSFELTKHLNENHENLLVVYLDSTERKDIPPYGFVVDYLTFGGIYREVSLRFVEPCHITNVFVRPQGVLTDNPLVVVDVQVENQNDRPFKTTAGVRIKDADGSLLASATMPDLTFEPGSSTKFSLSVNNLPPIQRWSLDNPALYFAEVTLAEGQIDQRIERFGFREAEFRDDGFYLNGEHVKLMGLNRHQTYPYIGAAAPARLQRRDADLIQNEMACNIVRTSHYPQSRHFLDRCDEIGLLVFEEIPGWQHIGDSDWQALSLRNLQVMIERDHNHPSIILWGVRINESLDNEAFYTATNALAHQLDPTRQTGGSRYFQGSQFLEDVFTYNDFSDTVVDPIHTPHLITEFGGHMFPTKSWDHEERLLEHAMRHARVQDRQLGMAKVAGAIGWCAFDYNTHQEFGSGDHICYHGVMDIFRLPKYAAYFYASQIAPRRRVVLQAATVWSMGDRSRGGIDPLVIFSNCDFVEIWVGNDRLGCFEPDRASFPNLPHPPFQVTTGMEHLTWGKNLSDLRIIGIIDGKVAAEQSIASDGLPSALLLQVDDQELDADGADMTRVVFKIVDRYGNRLPYTNPVVTFEIDGPADLIGENPFALIGGQAALYLRARHESGMVQLRATTPRLAP
ncbi:MAG: glycoside hydrolase family 2 protein, partial [Chloroflexi bacterium]|nr:glycoside hydrolase family 2 protein [Chloroflexota bacterium]